MSEQDGQTVISDTGANPAVFSKMPNVYGRKRARSVTNISPREICTFCKDPLEMCHVQTVFTDILWLSEQLEVQSTSKSTLTGRLNWIYSCFVLPEHWKVSWLVLTHLNSSRKEFVNRIWEPFKESNNLVHKFVSTQHQCPRFTSDVAQAGDVSVCQT